MSRWIVFGIASAILIGIGFWTNRRIKKAADSEEGFLLGAKEMGPFVAAGTLMATGYSGWGFIGSPGTTYAYGTIEILGNFFFAPAITFGALFFANFMRKKGEECGGLTVPEYLAATHKGPHGLKRCVHFFAGLATFIFLSVYIVGQIRAVGYVASEWLGISAELSAMLFMVVIVIFTMQGGLLAVAITDTLMCMGMLVASVIVYFTIIQDVSLTELIANVSASKPEFINPTTSVPYGQGKYSVFLVFIYALLFTTTLPYMSVRFLAFKKNLKVHVMALMMAPMGILLSLVPFVGLYMFYKNPNLTNPDSAMPVFLNTYLHPAVGSIISLFIMFAMLSTISSVLQALASALSYDMFVAVADRHSKYKDLFNRGAVAVTALLGIIFTYLVPQGMLNHIAYIGTGGLISMFVGPIIMRVLVEANLLACFSSMIVGFSLNVYLVLFAKVGWVEAPIMAGVGGCIVYLILGYVGNGMRRAPLPSEA